VVRETENDDSRKDAKHAKFGDITSGFSLRSWRLGAIKLLDVVPAKAGIQILEIPGFRLALATANLAGMTSELFNGFQDTS
jgi:hypothetical protein